MLALHKLWLSSHPLPHITIYERDTKVDSIGREGYSLSIRSDKLSGGMQALQKQGLLDSLLAESITGVQENPGTFVLWDRHFKEIVRMSTKKNDSLPAPSMRIARRVLRRQLVEAVLEKDQKILWDSAVTSARELGDGRVQIELSNGKTDECDLLIAADGSRSKIRATLRPDDNLSFAGVVCVSGDAKFAAEEGGIPKPVDRDWGSLLGGNGTGVFVSPVDDRSAIWSLSYLSPSPRPKLPEHSSENEELLKEALELSKPFAEPLQTLIKATSLNTLSVLNASDKQPFRHNLDSRVVYIGDANHAVSPFAGNGANLALMDGWDLAEQLCKVGHDGKFSRALEEYDALSVPRAKKAVDMSHRSIAMAHATGWRLYFSLWLLWILSFFILR